MEIATRSLSRARRTASTLNHAIGITRTGRPNDGRSGGNHAVAEIGVPHQTLNAPGTHVYQRLAIESRIAAKF
jgi:hypothetical protein